MIGSSPLSQDDIRHYELLLELLFNAIEVNGGIEFHDIPSAGKIEGLLLNVLFNANTALKVYNDTEAAQVEGKVLSYSNFFAVNMLSRSVTEAYLKMRWIFFESTTIEEAEYKLRMWKACSFRSTMKSPVHYSKAELHKKFLNGKFHALLSKIVTSNYHLLQKKKKRDSIVRMLRSAKLPCPTVYDMFKNNGLEYWLFNVYTIANNYVHAGESAISQLRNFNTVHEQQAASALAMKSIMIFVALSVLSYCKHFQRPGEMLKKIPDECVEALLWAGRGRKPIPDFLTWEEYEALSRRV